MAWLARRLRDLGDVLLPLVVVLLLPGGCTPQQDAPPKPPPPPTANACETPRPQMCMELYQPACGFTKDGASKTYPNSCHACANAEVVRFEPGACKTP